MADKRKKKLNKPKIFVAILIAFLSIYLMIKAIILILPQGVKIDYIPVSELSLVEKNQLRKYDNSYHLAVAKDKGLTDAFEGTIDETAQKVERAGLVRIDDNKYYEIPLLTNSLPYLQPDASDFLNDLGKRFVRRLKKEGIIAYRYSVTSVLRTEKSQKKLRKINVNATNNNSSHYYGRTFDIAQTRFFERGNAKPVYSYRLRNILLRELIDMQNEGLCYVLLESQTKCIHVTVR